MPGGFTAIGVSRNGVLVGGCLYTDYRKFPDGGSIQIWAAGHGWVSRRVIGVMFGYPFLQLNCHRATTLIAKPNKASRKLVEGIGFKLEGVARKGFNTKTDLCIYGLLRDECRWKLI